MMKLTGTPAPQRSGKATRIAEKNRAIALSARKHFLRNGFGGASMDAIASSAGVSVKTLYSHFADKKELFSKVMVGACSDHFFAEIVLSEEALAKRFPWFSMASRRGLFEAGKEYLTHLLSEEQLALYRVVTRDADRFPELGRQYQQIIARGRTAILVAYLKSTYYKKKWTRRNAEEDAVFYEGLLRARIFEPALHGVLKASTLNIEECASFASRTMWSVFRS